MDPQKKTKSDNHLHKNKITLADASEAASQIEYLTVKGEVKLYELDTVRCIFSSKTEDTKEISLRGKLILTNFKLRFVPFNINEYGRCFNYKSIFNYWSENDIPLRFIYRIFNTNKPDKLSSKTKNVTETRKKNIVIIICKNFLTKRFCCHDEKQLENFCEFFKNVLKHSTITNPESICVFSNRVKQTCKETKCSTKETNRTKLYLCEKDFIDEINEKSVKDIVEVKEFLEEYENEITPVQTSSFYFKEKQIANKNFNEFLLIWSFTYGQDTKCSLVKVLSNKVTLDENYSPKIIMSNKSLDKDEIRRIELSHNDISKSFKKLMQITAYSSKKELLSDDANWHSRLSSTKWIDNIKKIFDSTNLISNGLVCGKYDVLIEEISSKDISCILSSLTMICLSNQYRTIYGFQELIQKEWFSVGHMFSERLQIVGTSEKSSGLDRFAPVFLLFLDCVHQILKKHENLFQFNEKYLMALLDLSISGVSVTFSFNGATDWKRYASKHQLNVESYENEIWDWCKHLKENKAESIFVNTTYKATNEIISLNCAYYDITFWDNCYLRWHPSLKNLME